MSVDFLPCGDTGLSVQFGETINRKINARVIRFRAAVESADITGILETVPSYRSLLVHYDPLAITQAQLIDVLRPLVELTGDGVAKNGRLLTLPVCFEDEFAVDLAFVAEWAGLTCSAVIEIMTNVTQFVYMLGFAPGQPYLGDLPDKVALPRRKNPVLNVPAGAVVIATGKTTIYPISNPTGWHILGRTPVSLFDPYVQSPTLIQPGDSVAFERISRSDFDRIAQLAQDGRYSVPMEGAT